MVNNRIRRLLKILAGVNSSGNEEFLQLEGRLEHATHFLVLVYRSFVSNRCFVRASALSYSTLLSIIPLLAVALSVTSSLLKNQDQTTLNRAIEHFVASVMPSTGTSTNFSAKESTALTNYTTIETSTNLLANGTNLLGQIAVDNGTNQAVTSPGNSPNMEGAQKEIARQIGQFVHNSSSGVLGVTGMIILVFTAISLLRGIEETFNNIWGVTHGRSWLRQIVLYWTIITLGPVLMLGLSGGTYLQQTRSFMESTPWLAPIYLHVLPIIVMSLGLALFYKVTPNTEVKFRPALVGGFVAGTAWHFYNQLGFLLASRANSASKIYGSLFLVVLLMGGLYIVWVILLIGAQIAYAYQNRVAYLQDKLAENVNHRGREFVALRLMTFIGQRFHDGHRPATISEISAELRIPSRLVQQVLRTLLSAHLVIEVNGAEAAYSPARPLQAINAWQILLAMRTTGGQTITCADEQMRRGVFGEFARIEDAERAAASAVTLISLLNQPAAPLAIGPEADASKAESLPVPIKTIEQVKPVDPPTETSATPTPENIEIESPPSKSIPPIQTAKISPSVIQPEDERDFPL